jgi:hypothetical protein
MLPLLNFKEMSQHSAGAAEKTAKNLSQEGRFTDRDKNPEPPPPNTKQEC